MLFLHFEFLNLVLLLKCKLFALDAHTIRHFDIVMAAVVTPTEIFVPPGSPNRCMVIYIYILGILRSDVAVCFRLSFEAAILSIFVVSFRLGNLFRNALKMLSSSISFQKFASLA